MDVDNDASVQIGADHNLAREGRLDVAVNNAGIDYAGSIEDLTLADAHQLLETNFFGLLRVCRGVLPVMRRQGEGLMVNVTSIGAQITLPFQGHYTAGKLALEGATQALRMEAGQIRRARVMVARGDFLTGFTAHRVRGTQAGESSAYAAPLVRTLQVIERDEREGMRPKRFARLIECIVQNARPRSRYIIGPAFERLALGLKGILPAEWLEAGVRLYYQVG